MKLQKFITGVVLAVLFTGCVPDKLDFEMAEDIRLKPDVEAPLVKARMSLNDLVRKDSSQTLVVDPDNSIRIKYHQDEIFSFLPMDFVDIPGQDPFEIDFMMHENLPVADFSMGLGTVGGVELKEVNFYTGNLQMDLVSPGPLSEDVEVELTITNAIKNGQPLSQRVVLPAGNTSESHSVSLPGTVFDFSNNGQSTNYIGLQLEVINPHPALNGDSLKLSLQFTDLEPEEATGYFGHRLVNVPSGAFDFDVSGIKELAEGFYVTQPSIRLITASSIGVEMELAPDLDGVNNIGKVTGLDAAPQMLDAASTVSTYDTSIMEFIPANSNVVDFLAALPSRVLYAGKAELNPNGHTTENFVHRNSRISVGVDIEVPLELSIKDMRLEQNLNDIDFFQENPEQVEELTLIFYSSNGFPFGLEMAVAFLDKDSKDSIQGFDLGLLKPATVGSNGEILQRGEYPVPQEITFTGDMLEKLKQSNSLRFRATINTANDGQSIEKFYTHHDVEIKVAAKAKLNIAL